MMRFMWKALLKTTCSTIVVIHWSDGSIARVVFSSVVSEGFYWFAQWLRFVSTFSMHRTVVFHDRTLHCTCFHNTKFVCITTETFRGILNRFRKLSCVLNWILTQISATENCLVDLWILEVVCPNPAGTRMNLWQVAMDVRCSICSGNDSVWPRVIVERSWRPAVYLLCCTLPWLASDQFVTINGC